MIRHRDTDGLPGTGRVADDLTADLQERRELGYRLAGYRVENQLEVGVADRVRGPLGEIGALDEHDIGAGVQQRLYGLFPSYHVQRS